MTELDLVALAHSALALAFHSPPRTSRTSLQTASPLYLEGPVSNEFWQSLRLLYYSRYVTALLTIYLGERQSSREGGLFKVMAPKETIVDIKGGPILERMISLTGSVVIVFLKAHTP